ncbi:hypothetical protein WS73_02445 [Burkholderia savannae]|uniref:hypothetical protein n=1 Tax=Burkholderia savannae TaxID=1637837 RepID=UPI0007643587|nr:hypothetical protein [Burkholderia savannae]KWZ47466.1 hypothetical protein WS73_02445 [Burkholderia savannae]
MLGRASPLNGTRAHGNRAHRSHNARSSVSHHDSHAAERMLERVARRMRCVIANFRISDRFNHHIHFNFNEMNRYIFQ